MSKQSSPGLDASPPMNQGVQQRGALVDALLFGLWRVFRQLGVLAFGSVLLFYMVGQEAGSSAEGGAGRSSTESTQPEASAAVQVAFDRALLVTLTRRALKDTRPLDDPNAKAALTAGARLWRSAPGLVLEPASPRVPELEAAESTWGSSLELVGQSLFLALNDQIELLLALSIILFSSAIAGAAHAQIQFNRSWIMLMWGIGLLAAVIGGMGIRALDPALFYSRGVASDGRGWKVFFVVTFGATFFVHVLQAALTPSATTGFFASLQGRPMRLLAARLAVVRSAAQLKTFVPVMVVALMFYDVKLLYRAPIDPLASLTQQFHHVLMAQDLDEAVVRGIPLLVGFAATTLVGASFLETLRFWLDASHPERSSAAGGA